MNPRTRATIAVIAMALAACSTVLKPASKAEKELANGMDLYQEGHYPDASKSFQSALDMGLNPTGQVKAHKYLAFINCISGRERICRDEFGKALDINPSLELDRAEAGHPIWGPVFRSVKAKRTETRK